MRQNHQLNVRPIRKGLVVLAFLALAAVPAASHAQTSPAPDLRAVGSGKIPTGVSIELRSDLRSELAGPVRDAIIKGMKDKGYSVADKARYVLQVEMDTHQSMPPKADSRIKLRGSAGSSSDDKMSATVDLGPRAERPPPGKRQVSVRVTFFENQGKPLWSATASLRGGDRAVEEVATDLARLAISRFGDTVPAEKTPAN